MSADRYSIIITSLMFFMTGLFLLLSNCTQDPVKSEELPIDITSHAMAWCIDTLRTSFVSSIIHDVAVIDENNIWAVGEFFIGDTIDPSGLKTEKCNIVKWNGTQWNYEWLYCNGIYASHELFIITAFCQEDVWLSDGNLFHFDGETWTLYQLWDMGLLSADESGILAMWGPSPDDVYFVGYSGVILHWNGSLLSRIISPTTKDLTSIAGTNGVIWASGYNSFTSSNEFIEYSKGSWKVKELPGGWPGSIGNYLSCGAYGDTLYLAGTYCMLVEPVKNPDKRKLITYSWIDESDEYDVGFSFNDILILGYTDIFFSNGRGNIYHYNGSTLHKYPMQLDGYMTGIDGKDNIVVAVGYDSKTAYVFRGYR